MEASGDDGSSRHRSENSLIENNSLFCWKTWEQGNSERETLNVMWGAGELRIFWWSSLKITCKHHGLSTDGALTPDMIWLWQTKEKDFRIHFCKGKITSSVSKWQGCLFCTGNSGQNITWKKVSPWSKPGSTIAKSKILYLEFGEFKRKPFYSECLWP